MHKKIYSSEVRFNKFLAWLNKTNPINQPIDENVELEEWKDKFTSLFTNKRNSESRRS